MKHILLAVDPFVDELRPTPSALAELKNWLAASNAQLELVYVAPVGTAKERYFDSGTLAEHFLRSYAEELGCDPRQTRVLFEESSSTRRTVHTLIHHARKSEADLIVLTSHGRRVIGRVATGSFADTLLAESPIPLLFLPSNPTQMPWSDNVLFPTDLSPGSRRAFDLYLEQFAATKPHTIVLHIEEHEKSEELEEEEGARWIEYAYSKGFSSVLEIIPQTQALPKAILDIADREQAGLLALASGAHATRLRSLLSVASSVFYQHRYPVWICGPEVIREEFSRLEGEVPRQAPEKPTPFPLSRMWAQERQ